MAVVAVAWSGTKTVTADNVGTWNTGAYNADIHIEGSACRGKLMKASAGADRMYNLAGVGAPYNFAAGQANDGDHIFGWIGAMTAVDTQANGGLRIVVADDLATDSVGEWYVGKGTGYLNGWFAFVIDPKLAFDNLVAAGTAVWTAGGNPAQLTGVDGFGGGFLPLTSPTGNSPNMFVDAFSVGKGYRLTAGDSTSADGKFTDFTNFENELSGTTSINKFGGIRIASGIVFAKCKLFIGAESGSTNTEFTDNGFVVVWEDARVAATFYELKASKGTGTTTIVMGNGLLAANSPQVFALSLAGVTSVTMTNMTVDRASPITLDSAVSWIGGTIKNSGQITASGATLQNLDIRNSTATTALLWAIADPTLRISGTSFTSAGTGHGLEITGTPANITLTNNSWTGYTAASGGNEAVYINTSAGSMNLTISGGTVPSVRVAAGVNVTIIESARTVKVSAVDVGGTAVTDTNVFVKASSTAAFPFRVSVSIERSVSTATVTHSTHGLATNDLVLIEGCTEPEYNGVFSITKIDDNSYSYTVSGSPATPAGGSPKSTFVFLKGSANAGAGNNEISMSRSIPSSQPVIGWARKATSGTRYKEGAIAGTVSSTDNTSFSAVMIEDE